MRCRYLTGEDGRERIGARLNALMNELKLRPDERAQVIERLHVIDLVGKPFRLCELDRAGNVTTSDGVSRLIDTIGPLEPGIVDFDPLASFGAPEQSVNDAAQGAVNAARRIIRELECCVRITHHTGQVVARENIKDQYAPRGGSALSDGARMVHVISRPNESEPLPFAVGPDDQVFVLSRPKLSYCPPQPDILIKRSGYCFEYSVDVKRTEQEKRSDHANQLEAFLVDQLKLKRYHSKNTLESLAQNLKLTRTELRAALSELAISGRVSEKELPDDLKRGGRKAYLRPNLAGFETGNGEVGSKNGENMEASSPGFTTSPPYRKKNGGEVDAACFSSPFPQPRGEGSARFGDVGEVGSAFAGETEILDYLQRIGETDKPTVESVLSHCKTDPEALAFYLERARVQ